MAASPPRVSIVIPFLDPGPFLVEAIESVLAQTWTDWELLLVDDGSTDGSTDRARQYEQRHTDRVRYLEHAGHANRGACASRNLGVWNASGEYIALLDADDVWLPCKLERQIALFEAHPDADLVYGAIEYWHGWTGQPDDAGRDRVPPLGVEPDTLYRPPAMATLLYPLGKGQPPTPSDLMVRRQALIEAGGFEESFTGALQLYEDQALLSKLYLKNAVFVSSETWARYRIHSESCSSEVQRMGEYRSVRLHFLRWLEAYLQRSGVRDPGLAASIETAIRVTEHPDRGVLRTGPGNKASLSAPAGAPQALRIEIADAGTTTSHDIQLNLAGRPVQGGERYRVEFLARADRARSIGVGFAKGHPPWSGLGLYREVRLTPEWQTVRLLFLASADDANGRIHFDLGGGDAAVELDEIGLWREEDGALVEPASGGADHPAPVEMGALRRIEPISRNWGFDRGQPVDRYYVERFLAEHAGDIRGRAMEIEDDAYIRRFGGTRVTATDILHVEEGNPRATIVGDLTRAGHIPSERFDCIVLTQTLHLIYDVRAALDTLHRILAPGGVLLATFPGLSKTSHAEWPGSWYWGFTTASARRLFDEAFPGGDLEVAAHGNVLAAIAFLHGLAVEDLRREELDARDPEYELLITVRARKAGESP